MRESVPPKRGEHFFAPGYVFQPVKVVSTSTVVAVMETERDYIKCGSCYTSERLTVSN